MCCSCRLLRGLGKETVKLPQSAGTGALYGSLSRLWACSKEAEFGLASPELALTADVGIIFGLGSSITFSRLTGDRLSTLQAPRGLPLRCGCRRTRPCTPCMDTALIPSKPQEGFLPPRLPFLEHSASRSGRRFEGLGILLAELLPPLGELGMTLRDRDRVAVSHPGVELPHLLPKWMSIQSRGMSHFPYSFVALMSCGANELGVLCPKHPKMLQCGLGILCSLAGAVCPSALLDPCRNRLQCLQPSD